MNYYNVNKLSTRYKIIERIKTNKKCKMKNMLLDTICYKSIDLLLIRRRKSLRRAWVIIFSILFVGCSTPSSVVKKTMNAYIQKDSETVFKYYYNLSDSDKENLRKEFKNDNDEYNIVNFKIQDERIFSNREKAEVIIKCFFKNGNEVTDNKPLVKTRSGWKLVRD